MCVCTYASCNHDYWLQCLYHTLKHRQCDNYVYMCMYAPHSHDYWLPVLFCLLALYLRDVAIAAVFLYYCQCLKLMCLHILGVCVCMCMCVLFKVYCKVLWTNAVACGTTHVLYCCLFVCVCSCVCACVCVRACVCVLSLIQVTKPLYSFFTQCTEPCLMCCLAVTPMTTKFALSSLCLAC